MTASTTEHARVLAALTDPALTVPAAPEGQPPGGIGWLRAAVARFCDGPAHDRRRATAVRLLSTAAPAALRTAAIARTTDVLAGAAGPVDLMAAVARVVPTAVLADALGIGPVRPDAVLAVAAGYPTGDRTDATDDAVAELVHACGGVPDEPTAALIGLLAQACDATAALVGLAVLARHRAPDRPHEAVVREVLRTGPPVRCTRRVGADGVLVLDIGDAGLPFGAGPHECPARTHAEAITLGVLDATAGCVLRSTDPAMVPSVNLTIPEHVLVDPR